MKKRILDWLYMGHIFVVWGGCLYEIIHIYGHQSARDVTLGWVCALLLGELMALPRSIKSDYFVWKLCHIGGSVLLATLLIGVVLYR